MQALFQDLKDSFILNFVEANRWKFLLEGLGNTLLITLLALILGVVLGTIIAVVRSTYDKTADTARKNFGRKMFGLANGVCKWYLTILRGTPVVVSERDCSSCSKVTVCLIAAILYSSQIDSGK